jgi:enoyl-CoA hydratase/carnithine racemase
VHGDLGACFAEIAADPENDVLIVTGTGDRFCDSFEAPEGDVQITPAIWDHIFGEGLQLPTRLLEIPVPVIGAVNGPATLHAELALLGDVVLCTDDAVFADRFHFASGFVPGDGAHLIWPLLLGLNRARYFMLTGQEIPAAEALRIGLVGEVLTRDALMPRALELAREIQRRPPLTRRYTRMALTQELRLVLQRGLGYGLALEGLAAVEGRPKPEEWE